MIKLRKTITPKKYYFDVAPRNLRGATDCKSFFSYLGILLQMANKLLYKIRISGQVQGVGFRWRAAHEAWNLGITGFVKNISDGSVYIEAEGFSDQLNAFVVWCRKGPGTGFVDNVEIDTCPPVNFKDFTIEH